MNRALPVALAGAAACVWAAVPMGHAGAWGVLLLLAASLGVMAGTARLALLARPRAPGLILPGAIERLEEGLAALIQGPPWEVVAAVALVVLEALHPGRAWHTGVLGLLVTGYLLLVSRAEAVVPRRALFSQARLAGLGLALLALLTATAMLPSGSGGRPAAWLEALGALAAIAVAAMALPAQ